MRHYEPLEKPDLYWLAGLLEGEGSFQKPAPSQPTCPRITLQMSDRDVIERVAKFFGRNYIYTDNPKRANHSKSYSVLVKSRRAIHLMHQVYPLMGERRRKQIENAINERPDIHDSGTPEEWFHWLAGLLEGEGSFMKGSPNKLGSPRIHLKMTDKDVVEKAATLLGAKYNGPYRPKPKNETSVYKPFYVTLLWGSGAIEMMKRLRPLMGQRRQSQIDEVIAAYDAYVPKPHPFGESHPQAKLTAEKVRDIKRRLAEGEKQSRLAREYEVDTGLIWQIKAGRIWQHVT